MLYMVVPGATSSGRNAIPGLDDACVNRLHVRTLFASSRRSPLLLSRVDLASERPSSGSLQIVAEPSGSLKLSGSVEALEPVEIGSRCLRCSSAIRQIAPYSDALPIGSCRRLLCGIRLPGH
jgi:hypothetical protein